MRNIVFILIFACVISGCSTTKNIGTETAQQSLKIGQVQEGSQISFETIDGRKFEDVKVISLSKTTMKVEQNGKLVVLPIGEVEKITTKKLDGKKTAFNSWLIIQSLIAIGAIALAL